MKSIAGSLKVLLPVVAFAFIAGGCDDFLTVENPSVIDERALDLEKELGMLSHSAYQEWVHNYGWMIQFSTWFTYEADKTGTGTLGNSVSRRDVNNFIKDDYIINLGDPPGLAIAAANRVLKAATELPDADRNLHVARVYFSSGFTLAIMGENFCQGVIEGGPPMSSTETLDSAVVRLSRARQIALAAASNLSGVELQEATDIANAASVGVARAELQAGRLSAALAAAGQVPDGFEFSVKHSSDPSNRDRLANRIYWRSYDSRTNMSVTPAFRAMNDPRVPFLSPAEHSVSSSDGSEYWPQAKYMSYDAPIRLASKLEADYITAEAQGTAAQLVMIQEQRAANGFGPYGGPTDAQSVLVEFMDQRAREFFFEGKRLGDNRRHPSAMQYIPAPGAAYRKDGFGPIGSDTCWPQPDLETGNNPNWSGGG